MKTLFIFLLSAGSLFAQLNISNPCYVAGVLRNALVPHWADGISVGNFDNSANWQEISGMATPQVAANAGYIWIISDSPANMLACVSATNASVEGVYTLATPPAYSDWEDIASGTVGGQPFIYVAEIGRAHV